MCLSRQYNCCPHRCSWSIAYRRCSNYIFIVNLTPSFNGLGKDNYTTRGQIFNFGDLVRCILDVWWYCSSGRNTLWPIQNSHHFAQHIIKYMCLYENIYIYIYSDIVVMTHLTISHHWFMYWLWGWTWGRPLSEGICWYLRWTVCASLGVSMS